MTTGEYWKKWWITYLVILGAITAVYGVLTAFIEIARIVLDNQ